jgi:poly(hydroxyalkanoate) depolymerase family esterase
MPRLGETAAALRASRRAADARLAKLNGRAGGPKTLTETRAFGANPGALRMLSFRPPGLGPIVPLVVVLHGCTQGAEDYARGAGWLTLAERTGFAVLAPEQTSANNPNRCFNWFEPRDVRRGEGEVASIRQMVEHMIETQGIDPSRVFVTGLSAGGAMTSALLAAYPETFAGGAIVAGLPYGVAGNVSEAMMAMYGAASHTAPVLGDLVRAAAAAPAAWPRVSVWHGDADTTVTPLNADQSIRQWTNVHGLAEAPSHSEAVGRHRREVWLDADGEPRVESYRLAGLGHGAALAATGPDGLGATGAFLLEVGLSSTLEIARFWGLTAEAKGPDAEVKPKPAKAAATANLPMTSPIPVTRVREEPMPPKAGRGVDIHAIITKALTTAGLMK